jgi:hypothetical protein
MQIVILIFGGLIIAACLWGFFRGLVLPPRKDPPDSDTDSIIGSSGGPPLN